MDKFMFLTQQSWTSECWCWCIFLFFFSHLMMRTVTTATSVLYVCRTCETHSSFPADTCVCATPVQILCVTRPTTVPSAGCVRRSQLHPSTFMILNIPGLKPSFFYFLQLLGPCCRSELWGKSLELFLRCLSVLFWLKLWTMTSTRCAHLAKK